MDKKLPVSTTTLVPIMGRVVTLTNKEVNRRLAEGELITDEAIQAISMTAAQQVWPDISETGIFGGVEGFADKVAKGLKEYVEYRTRDLT